MEIFLSSETTETKNWFSNVTMLHLLMTYMLLLNVILTWKTCKPTEHSERSFITQMSVNMLSVPLF